MRVSSRPRSLEKGALADLPRLPALWTDLFTIFDQSLKICLDDSTVHCSGRRTAHFERINSVNERMFVHSFISPFIPTALAKIFTIKRQTRSTYYQKTINCRRWRRMEQLSTWDLRVLVFLANLLLFIYCARSRDRTFRKWLHIFTDSTQEMAVPRIKASIMLNLFYIESIRIITV